MFCRSSAWPLQEERVALHEHGPARLGEERRGPPPSPPPQHHAEPRGMVTPCRAAWHGDAEGSLIPLATHG